MENWVDLGWACCVECLEWGRCEWDERRVGRSGTERGGDWHPATLALGVGAEGSWELPVVKNIPPWPTINAFNSAVNFGFSPRTDRECRALIATRRLTRGSEKRWGTYGYHSVEGSVM